MELGKRVGFIGAGNMARAILKGMISAGLIRAEHSVASDAIASQQESFSKETGATIATSNAELAKHADVVIFATKPFQVADVCREIQSSIRPGQLFISICAGIPTKAIESALGGDARVIRVMPNTPALIGCGTAGVAAGRFADEGDLQLTKQIFDSVGKSVVLPEDKLDLVTGLTGSGPAYVFRFMEVLLDAGTSLGLNAEEAQVLVPQMVLGAVRMAMESGKPLHELRQNVTTKGGTTEAGLKVLEEGEFGQLMHDCVEAATKRSRELAG